MIAIFYQFKVDCMHDKERLFSKAFVNALIKSFYEDSLSECDGRTHD